MNSSLAAAVPSDTSFVGLSTRDGAEDLTKFTVENNAGPVSHSHSADLIDDIINMLWYVVPPVLLVFGTFGNVMIVVVMRGMRAAQSTASLSLYFTALAVSDQCLLLTSVLWFWIDMVFSWPVSFFRYDLLCTIPKFVWYVSSLTSAWFLVAMTYQRVTSVVVPHRVAVLCTVRRGKAIIAAIVVLACVINVHFMFTWSYWPEHRQCLSRERHVYFLYLFTWLDFLLASVIPFVVLATGNCILIGQVTRSMRISRKMRVTADRGAKAGSDNKVYPMTVTLIFTSTAFLILTLPTCFFVAYESTVGDDIADEEFSLKLNLAGNVALLLWFCNSAVNFYLYVLSGSKFRQATKRCLRWPNCGRSAERSSSSLGIASN